MDRSRWWTCKQEQKLKSREGLDYLESYECMYYCIWIVLALSVKYLQVSSFFFLVFIPECLVKLKLERHFAILLIHSISPHLVMKEFKTPQFLIKLLCILIHYHDLLQQSHCGSLVWGVWLRFLIQRHKTVSSSIIRGLNFLSIHCWSHNSGPTGLLCSSGCQCRAFWICQSHLFEHLHAIFTSTAWIFTILVFRM
jgi:hypothetical protein